MVDEIENLEQKLNTEYKIVSDGKETATNYLLFKDVNVVKKTQRYGFLKLRKRDIEVEEVVWRFVPSRSNYSDIYSREDCTPLDQYSSLGEYLWSFDGQEHFDKGILSFVDKYSSIDDYFDFLKQQGIERNQKKREKSIQANQNKGSLENIMARRKSENENVLALEDQREKEYQGAIRISKLDELKGALDVCEDGSIDRCIGYENN